MRIPLLFFGILLIGILAAALPNIAQAAYACTPSTCGTLVNPYCSVTNDSLSQPVGCNISCTSCSSGCSNGACTSSTPAPACSADSDCNDNNACTTDTCSNGGTASASCSHGNACSATQVCNTSTNQCVVPACSVNSDCNDNNACTTDTCSNGGTASALCSNTSISGCGTTPTPPPSTADTTAPTPGNSGTITTASVASATLTLNWTRATDNVTIEASLQYRAYRSSSNNIGTVANAESNGTALNFYTADINTFGVTGLSPSTTYYFNVIVKDGAGNKAVYTTRSETTAAPPLTTTCNGRSTSLTTATLSPNTSWQTRSVDSLASSNDTKRYQVNVSTIGTHDFSLCVPDGGTASYDSWICLFDSTGESIINDDDSCDNPSLASKISRSITSTGTYYLQVSGYQSNYGNYTLAYRRVSPDTTPPTSSFRDDVGADTPDGGSWRDSNFTVYPSDSDNTGGSGLSGCYYGVYSDDGNSTTNDWTVAFGTARTCNSSFTVTVGPSGDCRNTGDLKCQVQIYSTDVVGNQSATSMRAFSIGFLTFPTSTWQRLWYTTSGSSPNVSFNTFLGEGPGSNDKNGKAPDVTSETFNTDWGSNNLAFGTPNTIGFKSSRTINFPAADLYRFTVGSDDGVRLFLDPINETSTPFCDQWSTDGYRTKSCDVSIPAGDHKFRLDYYENTDNAKVSFDYALTPVCPAPSNIDCGVTSTIIRAGWGSVTGITDYKLMWKEDGTSTWSSATTPNTLYDITNLKFNTKYNLKVQGETDNNTSCNAPTASAPTLSPYQIDCTTINCGKVDTPFHDPHSVNDSSCTVTITHSGQDLTDQTKINGVSYSRLTPVGSPATIEMDDELADNGDCDLDLKFTNSWSSTGGKLTVTSKFEQYDSGGFFSTKHDYDYGYTVSSSNCAIKDITEKSCSYGNSNTSCLPPSLSGDKRSAVALQPYEPQIFIPQIVNQSQYEYTLVECTQDSHCTTDPNKAKCSLITNTCIDSVLPTSKITSVVPTLGGTLGVRPQQSGEPSGTKNIFFNAPNLGNTAKYYTIAVQDTDNIDSSSQLSCYYQIQEIKVATGATTWLSPEFTRPCSNTFSFPVGTIGAGGYCAEQGNDTCRLRTWAIDRAANSGRNLLERRVHDKYDDETRYTDTSLAPNGFDTFWFGVDWTPPSAQ